MCGIKPTVKLGWLEVMVPFFYVLSERSFVRMEDDIISSFSAAWMVQSRRSNWLAMLLSVERNISVDCNRNVS